MNKKHWYQSKTLWTNLVVGLGAVVAEYNGLIGGVLGERGLEFILLGLAVANLVLRLFTNTAIRNPIKD